MGGALAYLAAGVSAAWGVAHIMPTGRVVAGFGSLSKDNRFTDIDRSCPPRTTVPDAVRTQRGPGR